MRNRQTDTEVNKNNINTSTRAEIYFLKIFVYNKELLMHAYLRVYLSLYVNICKYLYALNWLLVYLCFAFF